MILRNILAIWYSPHFQGLFEQNLTNRASSSQETTGNYFKKTPPLSRRKTFAEGLS